MSGCDRFREMLSSRLDEALAPSEARALEIHLESCEDCRELDQALAFLSAATAPVRSLDPPAGLTDEIASSPCRRWLGLLSRAVDHELGEGGLERLLSHMDSCELCRRAWSDLTLIHQVGEALQPPPGLAERCALVRTAAPRRQRILSRRMATAAAYILAVLTSIVIGNPVTLGRSPTAETVQRVAVNVTSGVSEAASTGRGELRVMLWRTWRWSARQIEALRDMVAINDNESSSELKEETDEQHS